MTDHSEAFSILEQAAIELIGATDKRKLLKLYQGKLDQLFRRQLGERQAAVLAKRFTEIIEMRHKEITTSAPVNLGTVQ